jgi:hypothetical protein
VSEFNDNNDFDPEKVLALQKQLSAARRLITAAKQNGLAFYKPHEKQDLFHRAGVNKSRRMYRAGNRSGKSTVGCAEDCAWLLGERPWYSPNDPARRGGIPQHRVKGLVITTDWDKVDEVFTSTRGGGEGKLWKYLPKGFVTATRKNHNGVTAIIECANGSILRFDTVKSFQNDAQSAESSDWDFIHVDEPIPQAMWKAASRGLIDRNGKAWFTLTPLREAWINDLFFPKDIIGSDAVPADYVWAIQGSIFDNPYLTKEAIAVYEAELTEDERQARLYGIPLHLSGLIYKQFDYKRHVLTEPPKGWKNLATPPSDWPVYVYIDFHPQTPHHILGLAVSPQGHKYYFIDEFIHCGASDLANLVKLKTQGLRHMRTLIDPSAFIEHPVLEGTTFGDELINNGLFVEKAHKDLAGGILLTQEALGKGKTNPHEQEIYFMAQCRRLLWEIQRYCWDEKENKPVDKDDHAMENLYRSVYDKPIWLDPAVGNDEPIADEVFDSNAWEGDSLKLDLTSV